VSGFARVDFNEFFMREKGKIPRGLNPGKRLKD